MTLATGKGGRYRYYKCNTKIGKGVHLCQTPSIPMQKLDGIVLEALADQVFTPDRVQIMMEEMRKHQRASMKDQEGQLKPLQKEMDNLKLATDRLYEAVEKGLLPMDETLTQRAHKLQARRQEILIEIAGLKRQREMPLDLLKPKQIGAFSKALRTKLLDRHSGFGKESQAAGQRDQDRGQGSPDHRELCGSGRGNCRNKNGHPQKSAQICT